MSDQPIRKSSISPALVALAAWVIPGTGYLLLGQRARGLTVGISILLLFILGLLIGGIRSLDVPGYDSHGRKQYTYIELRTDESGERTTIAREGTTVPKSSGRPGGPRIDIIDVSWAFAGHPVDEIRSKPWSIAQIMMGPLDVLCDWWSITLPTPVTATAGATPAVRSHSRINELGVLYTAVAGMLNLLAIIDSSHRASHAEAA